MSRFTDKKVPIILSVGLHLLIFSLLFINISHKRAKAPPTVNIVQAVAVSEPSLTKMSAKPAEPVMPTVAESTIRQIEQTTLKEPDVASVPIAKPIPPEQPKVATAKPPEPIKESVKTPVLPLQEPNTVVPAIAKPKDVDAKKLSEEKEKLERKKTEQALAQKRRQEEAKQLQKELAQESKPTPTVSKVETDKEDSPSATDADSEEEASSDVAKGDSKEASSTTTQADASGELDKYKAQIIQSISRKWIIPDAVSEKVACQLLVHVGPGGIVLSVDVLKESGDTNLDRSARNAIMKASPLPVPESAELFDNFRALRLTFRPEGIVSG